MKVKSESEVAQLLQTLGDPMDCSPPGSSVHGIFQARVLDLLRSPFITIFSVMLVLLLLCFSLAGHQNKEGQDFLFYFFSTLDFLAPKKMP